MCGYVTRCSSRAAPPVAAALFLSLHTVKTQARSIYRKLEASTRSRAVTQARDRGLLEG